MTYRKRLAYVVRKYLSEEKVTQAGLARDVGVSRQAINQILKEQQGASPKLLAKLHAVIQFELNEVIQVKGKSE